VVVVSTGTGATGVQCVNALQRMLFSGPIGRVSKVFSVAVKAEAKEGLRNKPVAAQADFGQRSELVKRT